MPGPYPPPMRALAAITGLVCSVAAAQQESILEVGRLRAERAIVTVGPDVPELAGQGGALESDMTRALKGVLADLRGKPLEDLRGCFPANPMLGDPVGGERVCVIHLSAGPNSKDLEVVRAKDGSFVAMELGATGPHPRRAELRRDRFALELASFSAYRAGFEAPLSEPRGEVFELNKPYVPGRFTMDQKTLGDRFLRGAKTSVPGQDRVLEEEKLLCRLPRGYDPRVPAGLLVWIDPGSSGRTPAPFCAALDELNIICVGAADAGNNRLVSNREQLAFDGVETVARRYHVDPRRVYVTGVSGGGRVSSMLLACFPDVFMGAVPIVGLATYERVPNGVGQFWPAAYLRPSSDLFNRFKFHRMAPITGSRDFNQIEIQHATDIMKRDGVNIRLFDYEHMGHELPTTERFTEALKWMDEPYRELRAHEEEAARKALDAYISRFGAKAPEDEPSRRLLLRATEVGPWTPPAWTAAELLGAVDGSRRPAP